jgi:hypothetical protein
MQRRSRDEWSAIIEKWRGGGLTAGDFSHREGIKKQTLLHWSWRLGPKTNTNDHGSDKPAKTEKSEAVGFIEVARPARSVGIELVLENGTIVRVPDGFDEIALARILRVAGGQQ